MLGVNFYLKSEKPNKNGEVHVFLQVTHTGWKSRINLFQIKPRYWSKVKKKVNAGRSNEPDNDHEFLNEQLTHVNTKVSRFFIEKNAKKEYVSKEDFEVFFKAKEKSVNLSFSGIWEQYLTSSGHRLKPGTVKGYKSILKLLNTFAEDCNLVLKFEIINDDFLNTFTDYFDKQEKSINYLAKVYRQIKTVYGYAIKEGICQPRDLSFIYKPEKVKRVVFLTMEELKQLAACKYENKTYEKVRDCFLFFCYAGIRISESRFHKSDVDYVSKSLTYRPDKKSNTTEQRYLVPQALEILKKYENFHFQKALPMISDQKFNNYLKICCQIAAIDTSVTIEKFRAGGETVPEVFPKHEIISAHVGRKTYNTLIAPYLNPFEHKKASGHSNTDMHQHYVGVNDLDYRKKMDGVFKDLLGAGD